MRGETTSEDAQRSLPAPGEYPGPEHTSPPPAFGVRKTTKHPASCTHAPAGTPQPWDLLTASTPPSVNLQAARGGGSLSGRGRGAVRKNPARLRGPYWKVAPFSWGASGRGLSSRQPKSVCPHYSASAFADRPLKWCFAQHGEQGKWGTR